MNSELIHKTVWNIGFNTAGRIINLFFQLIANIILTRILTPHDYGIVGYALIFIGFLAQFNDLGINSAVIRRKDLPESALYTGFSIKSLMSCFLFIITMVSASLASFFFDDRGVVNVIRVLSLTFLINNFSFIPSCLLARELNYKVLSAANTLAGILSSFITIILALLGFSYWSLVLGNISTTTVLVLALNFLHPMRIHYHFSKHHAEEFIKFGGKLFLSGFIAFIIHNVDNFIIGTVNGAADLGYYTVAFNWSVITCTLLSSMVISVLIPTFSRMQHDQEALKAGYLKVLEIIGFLSLLFYVMLFVISKDFLFVILGKNTEKWLPALNSLKILCIYGLIRALLDPVTILVIALGKSEVPLKANIIVAVIQLGLIYPALKIAGIEGVAALVTIAFSSQYIIYFRYFKREINLSYTSLMKSILPALVSSLAVSPLIIFQYFKTETSFLLIVAKLVFMTVIYIVVYGIITKWRFVFDIRNLLLLNKELNSASTIHSAPKE